VSAVRLDFDVVLAATDEFMDYNGNMRRALEVAFADKEAAAVAEAAFNNVYDVETHEDGTRDDNREQAMRAALDAVLADRCGDSCAVIAELIVAAKKASATLSHAYNTVLTGELAEFAHADYQRLDAALKAVQP
jgi:hypothetical protein